MQAHQPCDIVAVHPNGEILLIDVKKEGKRVIQSRQTATRIHRSLSDEQKALGVRLCYVDIDTGEIDLQ